MKVELSVIELRKVLPGLGKIIGTKSTLPVLGCLKVNCDAKQGISIEATNLDDYVRATVAGDPLELGEVLVPYEDLNKIVKGCGSGDFVRIHSDTKETKIQRPIGGNMVDVKVERVGIEEWPPVPKVNVSLAPLGEKFMEAFRPALECASEDESRLILNSVFLDSREESGHYVVGTDARHLFSANSFMFDLPQPIALPTRKFLQWKGFQEDGNWKIGAKEPVSDGKKQEQGWIKVESDHWTFITRHLEIPYPNWKQIVPSGTGTLIQFGAQAAEMLLKALPQMPGNTLHNQPIQLVIHDAQLLLQGRNAETEAWTTVPVLDVKITGMPVTVGLNRTLVAKALKFGLLELDVIDPQTPVVFKAGGKRLVVAALRSGNEETPPAPPQPSTPSPAESSPQVEPKTDEERTAMTKTVNRVEKHQSEQTEPKEPRSAFEQLQEQVEAIKDTLKGVVGQLNDVLKTVGQAYKEKRTTEKEMELIRESLQEIQKIKI